MNAIAKFQELRLPYHEAIGDRFQIDRTGWKALTEAVFPNAKTIDSVVMALAYCKARKLDVFKRPVHIVPMYSSVLRQMVETVWPGISELRTTAFRTGQYAGMDAAIFGPDVVDHLFEGVNGDKGNIMATVTFPLWCQVTAWRMLSGQKVAFVSPKIYWREAYARIGKTEVPNDMWQKRPYGQIEKCAEAAALRRAFPEEIGNDYAAEEMEGQALAHEGMHTAAPKRPPMPEPQALAAPVEREALQIEAQAPAQTKRPPMPAETAPAPIIEATADDVVNVEALLKDFDDLAASVRDEDGLNEAWDDAIAAPYAQFSPSDKQAADAIYARHLARVNK